MQTHGGIAGQERLANSVVICHAIDWVPGYRIPGFPKMDSNLVGSPGDRPNLQKRSTILIPREDADIGLAGGTRFIADATTFVHWAAN